MNYVNYIKATCALTRKEVQFNKRQVTHFTLEPHDEENDEYIIRIVLSCGKAVVVRVKSEDVFAFISKLDNL